MPLSLNTIQYIQRVGLLISQLLGLLPWLVNSAVMLVNAFNSALYSERSWRDPFRHYWSFCWGWIWIWVASSRKGRLRQTLIKKWAPWIWWQTFLFFVALTTWCDVVIGVLRFFFASVRPISWWAVVSCFSTAFWAISWAASVSSCSKQMFRSSVYKWTMFTELHKMPNVTDTIGKLLRLASRTP